MPYFNFPSGSLSNTSDANYRAWGGALSNLMSAAGWTKVATDVNWATAVVPPINTYGHYEVWRSGDTNGAAIYKRIYYGTSFSTTDGALSVMIATGHAGGSSMTGIVSGTPNIGMANSFSTANSRFSVGAGEDWVVGTMGNADVNIGACWIVERVRDPITKTYTNNFYFHSSQPSGAGGDRDRRGVLVPGNKWYGMWNEYQTGKMIEDHAKVSRGRVGVGFIVPFTNRALPPIRSVLYLPYQSVSPLNGFVKHNSYGEECTYIQQPIGTGRGFFVSGAGAVVTRIA